MIYIYNNYLSLNAVLIILDIDKCILFIKNKELFSLVQLAIQPSFSRFYKSCSYLKLQLRIKKRE